MSSEFWMICRLPHHEHSKTEPRQRYATEAEARERAQAMADEHGWPFVVLTATIVMLPRGQQKKLL